jgi:hypothetical protein
MDVMRTIPNLLAILSEMSYTISRSPSAPPAPPYKVVPSRTICYVEDLGPKCRVFLVMKRGWSSVVLRASLFALHALVTTIYGTLTMMQGKCGQQLRHLSPQNMRLIYRANFRPNGPIRSLPSWLSPSPTSFVFHSTSPAESECLSGRESHL